MGIVAIQTPGQVDEAKKAEDQQRLENSKASIDNGSEVADRLAAHVQSCWQIAKTDRARVDARLIDCLRRRKGEYSSDKLAAIKEMGGSDVFMMITGAKTRSAKAWLSDLFSPAGDKPYTLEPSPIPDISPEVKNKLIAEAVQGAQDLGVPPEQVKQLLMKHRERILDELKQDAESRADKMSDAIEDLLQDGEWREAFDEFLDDLVTFPAAIMKGLEFRRTKTLKWMNNDGVFQPVAGYKVTPMVRRVSPFRAYPAPSTGSKIDGHWFIEHHTYSKKDLAAMRGAPGYHAEGIAKALLQYGSGGIREWMWSESERSALEGRSVLTSRNDEIDSIELSGSLLGQMLIDFGMSPDEIEDPMDEYSVSVEVIGNFVIRALVNPDPAGKSDYFKACWQGVPGSFWGTALPETLADCQDTCNAAARALINNLGMASGPLVWVEQDRLAAGQNVNNIHPWKVFQSNSSSSGSSPGIGFFQPQSNSGELMSVYERFNRYADDITGMPAYAHGSDSGAGAAKTKGGLAMLMNAASKTMKHVVRTIDINIIEPVVEKCYNYLMLNSEDEDIKGDLRPKARGSESLMHKEESQMRQQELLAITGNEFDMGIIGKEGRREMLSEVFKTGDIPVDRILPTREEMKEKAIAQIQAEKQQLQQQGQVNAEQVQPA